MSDTSITGAELLQIIEQLEQLDAEKRDIAEQFKAHLNEAGSRGFDKRIVRKILGIRKKNRADMEEEEALLQLYLDAIDGAR